MDAQSATNFNDVIKDYVRSRLIHDLGLTPDGRFPTIEDRVSEMAEEANRGCGLSYDLFLERLSGMVDWTFPVGNPDRDRAIAAANRLGGYASPDELAKSRERNAEMGYCCHGIEINCCPCGCGDIE